MSKIINYLKSLIPTKKVEKCPEYVLAHKVDKSCGYASGTTKRVMGKYPEIFREDIDYKKKNNRWLVNYNKLPQLSKLVENKKPLKGKTGLQKLLPF